MAIPRNFQEWACSFSGCDGGNENAETWLCGIEWGAGSYNDGEYYKKLPIEIAKGKVELSDQSHDWKESITYPYGLSFAKLYAAIKGEPTEEYYNLATNVWDGSELFKLNLYPIAFDSTDEALWQQYKMAEITGFDEKNLFQTWCLLNRFPFFAKQRLDKKPKLIICTGVSYLREFFVCFGGNQSNSGEIQWAEIEPSSISNSGKRRYYWVNLNGSTTLVVIPFFSGPRGLNSNYLLEEMGKRIKDLA